MSVEIPNIRHLRVFLEVVDCRSISRAAPRVFLSQPAITQAIAKLENTLQTQLFLRGNDGMFVSDSGKVFALRVRRALELISSGLKSALSLGGNRETTALRLLQGLTTTGLRALVAVSEAKNFSVASRNIGISQSSLHRAARDLEAMLGFILFEKTSTGIITSKAARVLVKATKLAFSEVVQGRDEVNSIHRREIGRLVVGSMPLARTSLLPNAINKFNQTFPDINISVEDGIYDDLLNHLRQGDIDILLGALRFPLPADDILQQELFCSPISIVARPGHPLCRLASISLQQMQQFPWVIPREGAPTRAIFQAAFRDAQLVVPSRIVESGSQVLIRSLLLDSDRLTMISEHQIQPELDLGILQALNYSLEHADRPIGITMRRHWMPTKTQRYFIELLEEHGLAMATGNS